MLNKGYNSLDDTDKLQSEGFVPVDNDVGLGQEEDSSSVYIDPVTSKEYIVSITYTSQ